MGFHGTFRKPMRLARAFRGALRRDVPRPINHASGAGIQMKKLLIILAVLVVAGAAIGGGLYLVFPVQISTIGGLTHVYFTTLNPPAGTLSTEANAAYQAPAAAAPASADASSPSNDWPSYNRTVNSQRYSTLSEINRQNVGKL